MEQFLADLGTRLVCMLANGVPFLLWNVVEVSLYVKTKHTNVTTVSLFESVALLLTK